MKLTDKMNKIHMRGKLFNGFCKRMPNLHNETDLLNCWPVTRNPEQMVPSSKNVNGHALAQLEVDESVLILSLLTRKPVIYKNTEQMSPNLVLDRMFNFGLLFSHNWVTVCHTFVFLRHWQTYWIATYLTNEGFSSRYTPHAKKYIPIIQYIVVVWYLSILPICV